MIECKFAWEILVFDGRVIDRYFSGGSSEHYHIGYIESVEITTDRKGRQYLRMNGKGPSSFKPQPFTELSPEEIPQAQALVDKIQKAIAAS